MGSDELKFNEIRSDKWRKFFSKERIGMQTLESIWLDFVGSGQIRSAHENTNAKVRESQLNIAYIYTEKLHDTAREVAIVMYRKGTI